jgi:large repetitive protein
MAASINVVKFVNGQDADSPTGPHVPVGSTVTFTYVVTNTGDVTL